MACESWVQSLNWEDPLAKGRTTHSSILEGPHTPVFWPGKFFGQKSLACYSSWGQRELYMTE